MCLTRVYKKTKHNIQFGYKVFIDSDSGPRFIYHSYFFIDQKEIHCWLPPINKWISADFSDICDDYGKQYLSGFHFFETINQAKRYIASKKYYKKLIIRKIEIKNIIAYGVQWGIRCHVAKHMKILEEPCA